MSIGSSNVPDLAGGVPRCTGPPAFIDLVATP